VFVLKKARFSSKKIKFAKKDALLIFLKPFINIIRLATDEKHLF
jgi:hypothetical protein